MARREETTLSNSLFLFTSLFAFFSPLVAISHFVHFAYSYPVCCHLCQFELKTFERKDSVSFFAMAPIRIILGTLMVTQQIFSAQ